MFPSVIIALTTKKLLSLLDGTKSDKDIVSEADRRDSTAMPGPKKVHNPRYTAVRVELDPYPFRAPSYPRRSSGWLISKCLPIGLTQ